MKPRRKRVFISGPYSQGDVIVNIRNAIMAADDLLMQDFAPYCPHLTAWQHLIRPHAYEEWLDLDAEWLRVCDAVLRLDGASSGADRETLLARDLGIPIFHSVTEVVRWRYGLQVGATS